MLWVAVFGSAAAALPQPVVPENVEFQVNSHTTAGQAYPAIAMNGAGDVVVVWESPHDGGSLGIFGQRFNATGAPRGVEFQINSHTPSFQWRPAVAMDAAGDFVVAWNSTNQDGFSQGIFARQFDSAGSAQAVEFQVNTQTANYEAFPAVASAADGDFVVSWTVGSYGIGTVKAQRFDSAGARQGSEFQVPVTALLQGFSTIGMADDGGFVVAWHDFGGDVFARRFDGTGTPQGTDFRVNTYTPNGQYVPSVVMNPDGAFAIAWQSSSQDGSYFGVFAQRFDSAGARTGSEFAVNSFTASNQQNAAVARAGAEEFVVVWESNGQDGAGLGAFARRFGMAGPEQGSELRTNQSTADSQRFPAVAGDGDGNFMVVWESVGQDGEAGGVFGQRFERLPSPGAEFQVNVRTSGQQRRAALAVDPTGAFVVAWQSEEDGLTDSVFARRFDPAGVAKGGEFLVNSFTPDFQDTPAIASDADGDFVVVWRSLNQDGSGEGVFGRRFNSAGLAQGQEFLVNALTVSGQSDPSVGMDADGGFVVVFESLAHGYPGVFARRFDAAGTPQTGEFLVALGALETPFSTSISMESDGDFFVAFERNDGNLRGVFVQRFDQAGTAVGTMFQVNTTVARDQIAPATAVTPAGALVVTWLSYLGSGTAAPFAQRFDTAGLRVGSEFQVNVFTTFQRVPSVAFRSDGDFVVAWDSPDISARGFNWAGLGGDQFDVNVHKTSRQQFPQIGGDGAGGFVVVWESELQDGSGYGIFARRFPAADSASIDVDGDGIAAPLTDGRLILRYLFGFRGSTLIVGNAVGEDCTFCEAEEIEDRIASLVAVLDVDADGKVRPLTDGMLIFRYLFAVRGTALVAGVVSGTCTRCTFEAIEEHIAGLLP